MSFRAIILFAVLAVATPAWPLLADAQEAIFVVRHTDPPPVLRIDDSIGLDR